MKFKDLAHILWCSKGNLTKLIMYDFNKDLDLGYLFPEEAQEIYGNSKVRRIYPTVEDGIPYIVVELVEVYEERRNVCSK